MDHAEGTPAPDVRARGALAAAGLVVAAVYVAAAPGVRSALFPLTGPLVLLSVLAQAWLVGSLLALAGGIPAALPGRAAVPGAFAAVSLLGVVLLGVPASVSEIGVGGQLVCELALAPGTLLLFLGVAWATDRTLARLTGDSSASVATLLGRDSILPFVAVCLAFAQDLHRFALYSVPVRFYMLALLGLGCSVACGSRLSVARGPLRWAGVAGLLVVAGGLAWFDALLYRRLYPYMHIAAFVGTVGAGMRMAAALTPGLRLGRDPLRRVPFALVALAACILPLLHAGTRFELLERTGALGRVCRAYGISPGEMAGVQGTPLHLEETVSVEPRKPLAAPPDILLLSVDALRTDRFTEELMPAVSALAARGTVFERCRTAYPHTHPSMRVAFTGKYRPPGEEDTHETEELVWSVLKQAGYRTLAVGDIARQEYTEADEKLVPVPNDGETVVDAFIERLTALFDGPPPRAAWIHVVDPHAPYHPRSGGGSSLERYEMCVRESDEALSRLIPLLDAYAAKHPQVLAFFSDHGEEFGEHGAAYHGTAWYEESVRVPLFFVGPGIAAQRRADAVSLADLTPTLLDLVGLSPPTPTHGRSLARALAGEPLAPRLVRGEVARGGITWSRSAVLEPWKVIVNHVSGTIELYDLASDPGETVNVSGRFDEAPEELRRTMVR